MPVSQEPATGSCAEAHLVSVRYCGIFVQTRTVEPEKRPLLRNGCVIRNDGVSVGSGVSCAVRAQVI
jgi:hypothetical protein